MTFVWALATTMACPPLMGFKSRDWILILAVLAGITPVRGFESQLFVSKRFPLHQYYPREGV